MEMPDIEGLGSENQYLSLDNDFYKALACVPFVGIVASLCIQEIIAAQIQEASEIDKIVELLDLKNDYKFSIIISAMLSTAIMVVGVACL